MLPSVDELRKNYKSLPDQKLLELATGSASDLRPEALEALIGELKARGLDNNLDAAVEAQVNGLNDAELAALVSKIRTQACPYCGQKNGPLNAISVVSVKSYLIYTQNTRKLVIGCETCMKEKNRGAINSTLLLGWWGLPWGIIRTPIALVKNIRNFEKIKSTQASTVLQTFVSDYRGAIIRAGENDLPLADLLK